MTRSVLKYCRIFTALLLPAVMASVVFAQTRVSDADQRSIELAVAKYLTTVQPPRAGSPMPPMAPGRLFMSGNQALDPLPFQMTIRFTDTNPFFVRVDSISPWPPNEIPSSRTPEHLKQLAATLALNGIIDNSAACPVSASYPDCRFGPYSGAVRMSIARWWGDYAQITVQHRTPSQPSPTNPRLINVGGNWTCNVARTGNNAASVRTSEWQVLDCVTVQF